MESETTEILHCPFCGSRCAARGAASSRWVFCTDDDVCGYVGTEGPDAIAAHNTVAAAVRDHAALTAERDALRAQVAQLRVFKAAYDSEADYQERTSNHDNYRDQARSRQAQWDAVKGLLAALAATEPTPEATR